MSSANFHNAPDDEAVARGSIDKSGSDDSENLKTRFTVVLDKLEHLPGMMALTQLIQPSLSKDVLPRPRSITTEALRLIELSDRVSTVMKSSISDTLLSTDPMLSVFRMFGHLNGIKVSPAISVVRLNDLAHSVAEHAKNHDSDMILIPWVPPVPTVTLDRNSPTPLITPNPTAASNASGFKSQNPFDKTSEGCGIPGSGGNDISYPVSCKHSLFVRGVFSQSKTDVALFVDQNTLDLTSIEGNSDGVHVFLPFFGGPDDRLALDFLVQICANPRVKGTVVRMTKEPQAGAFTPVRQNTEIRMQSDTADNLAWERYARAFASDPDTKSPHSASSSNPHVEFKYRPTPNIPLLAAVEEAKAVALSSSGYKLVVVTGRSRQLALMDEQNHVGEAGVRETIGDIATAFVVAGVGSGVVVVQAAPA